VQGSPHPRPICYVADGFRSCLVTRLCDRPFLRLAVIGALFAALGLAGCGRKGPLDPPPGASVADQPVAPGLMSATGSRAQATPIGGQANRDNPGVGPDGQPLAPAGPNKRIPLDVLLN
jgi:predicted small lipoprotein YifL